jgi:LacI family transcriptional regulator
VTTVSRALKDGPELSLETRRSVQQTARELGYRINRAGLRLRTGKTNIISLVLDTQEQIGSFVSELIFGITEGLTQTPYHLILTPYSRLADAMEPIRYLVETGSVDGIIISRIEPDDQRVRYMIEHEMPFVTHGRTSTGIQHPFQDFDNEAFARIAVKRLAELGRKRIALLAPPSDLAFYNHMRQGFSGGLVECGLQEVPFDIVSNDDSMEEIGRAIRDLLRQPISPDGIVSGAGGASGTGGSTFALIAGLEEAGMILGRDVDIVAKQLFKRLPLFRKHLHVVHEDVRETGRELAKTLMGAIDGQPVSQLQNLFVPTEVISPPPFPSSTSDPGI